MHPLSDSAGDSRSAMQRFNDLEARVSVIEDTLAWFKFKGIRRFWGVVSLLLWVAQRLSLHFNLSSEMIQCFKQSF